MTNANTLHIVHVHSVLAMKLYHNIKIMLILVVLTDTDLQCTKLSHHFLHTPQISTCSDMFLCVCVCVCAGGGGVGSFAHLRGHRLFLKAGIHRLTQFNCTVIPEPETGFHIAFKMLDIDGNEHVDKKEFQKVWNVFSHLIIWHQCCLYTQTDKCKCCLKTLCCTFA